MYIKNQKELTKLIEQWENTPPSIYKNKFNILCSEVSKKSIMLKKDIMKELSKELNVKYETINSYLNIAHKNRIPLLTALKLANYLNVDITDLMKERKH